MKKIMLLCMLLLIMAGCNRKETDTVLLQFRGDTALKKMIEEEYMRAEGLSVNVRIEDAYYAENVNFGGYEHNKIFVEVVTASDPVVDLPTIEVSTAEYKEEPEKSYKIDTAGFLGLPIRDGVIRTLIENEMIAAYGKVLENSFEKQGLTEGISFLDFDFDFSNEEDKKAFIDAYQNDEVKDWTIEEWSVLNERFISAMTISVIGDQDLTATELDPVIKDAAAILPDGTFYALTYTQVPLVDHKPVTAYFEVTHGQYKMREGQQQN